MDHHNKIVLLVIRCYWLWTKEIQSHELLSYGEVPQSNALGMMLIQNEIELREVALAFALRLVDRKSKTSHWRFGYIVRKSLRKIKMVLYERTIEIQPRSVLRNADDV